MNINISVIINACQEKIPDLNNFKIFPNEEDIFGKYCKQFKTTITLGRHYRYKITKDTMILMHQILIKSGFHLNITQQDIATLVLVDVNKVMIFDNRE